MTKITNHFQSYRKLNPNMVKATFDKNYTSRVYRDSSWFLYQWMYKARSNGCTTYCVIYIDGRD